MLGLSGILPEHDYRLMLKTPRKARATRPGPPIELSKAPRDRPFILTWEQSDPSLPRAMAFRDSFFGNMDPFLTEHFSRYVSIALRSFDPEMVEQEHPDVVIEEAVERRLWREPPLPLAVRRLRLRSRRPAPVGWKRWREWRESSPLSLRSPAGKFVANRRARLTPRPRVAIPFGRGGDSDRPPG